MLMVIIGLDPLIRKVVFDEAGQSTEANSIVPIGHGIDQLALIGDTKQLPATVKSEYARIHGMEFSLFERLIEKGIEKTLLAVQYRMNPTIGGFPYMYFYAGDVTHGMSVEKFSVPKFPWRDANIPVMIIDVAGAEETDGVDDEGKEKTSFMNESECFVIREVVNRFLQGDTAANQIGIITTYSEQVKHSRVKYNMKSLKVTCDTVDRFQGDERDVIIFPQFEPMRKI